MFIIEIKIHFHVEKYCPRGEIQNWPTIHRGPHSRSE